MCVIKILSSSFLVDGSSILLLDLIQISIGQHGKVLYICLVICEIDMAPVGHLKRLPQLVW